MIHVSKHAAKRMRQRLGIPKKAVEGEALRAVSQGLQEDDFSGAFREYLSESHEINEFDGDYFVTPSGIHVVDHATVITVLPLPKEHKTTVHNTWKKKRSQVCD